MAQAKKDFLTLLLATLEAALGTQASLRQNLVLAPVLEKPGQ